MNRAKTYRQFINEAYIDDSGELQDFEAPRGDEYEYQILEQAQRIQEYLEEAGAHRVRLKIDDPNILIKFNYSGTDYRMSLDLDTGTSIIVAVGGTDNAAYEVYNDSTNSLFDLLASTGLEFLNY